MQAKERDEMAEKKTQNNLPWVKIGPPWSHFKASLMILISRNDTLCRRTKKKERERMRAKKEGGIRIIKRWKRVRFHFQKHFK